MARDLYEIANELGKRRYGDWNNDAHQRYTNLTHPCGMTREQYVSHNIRVRYERWLQHKLREKVLSLR